MTPKLYAYMPLMTYPNSADNVTVEAAIKFAQTLDCELYVTAFSIHIAQVSRPIGGLLLNIPQIICDLEEESRARCLKLHELMRNKSNEKNNIYCSIRESQTGLAGETAAAEARYFDVVLIPWSKDWHSDSDFAETVVFGAGRATILIPPNAPSSTLKHVAIAWDASRVAARAVGDLIPLLTTDCRITVLTVQDDKRLPNKDIAETLSASLMRRGFVSEPRHVALAGRTVARALQEAAVEAGAELLAMGGFGHSRLRDFVLGGATKGVLADLRLPVLLSH